MTFASHYTILFSTLFYLIHVLLFLIHETQSCPETIYFDCPDRAYSNGESTLLDFPFTNISKPECGHCVLNCSEHNHTVINCLGNLEANYLMALDINPSNKLIIVAAYPSDGLHPEKDPCLDSNTGFLSTQSVSFTNGDSPQTMEEFETFIRCTNWDGSQNWNNSNCSVCENGDRIYLPFDDGQFPESLLLLHGCSNIQVPRLSSDYNNFSIRYDISDECQRCLARGGRCHDLSNGKVLCDGTKRGKKYLGVILGIGLAAIILVLIIYWQRRKLKGSSIFPSKRKIIEHNLKFETVLKNYAIFAPKRYTYSDLKKMTNSFGEKLGEGGFGGVYKGKLVDGRLVAVKLLKNSEGDREGFINEVASIGRTNHVNVVTLLGFCYERHKRALIYEYMANGSLEKFMLDGANNRQSLPLETLFHIVLGIARGLKYLHRGCKTRILHFDIKPHNILLDEEFCPKISDFGLAKLTPQDKQSKISMSGTRGTIGYIAPEVFCRTFGDVSHKADVYSYGMMVLEVIGGRKRANTQVDESSSDLYFPQYIYKQLERGEDVEIDIAIDENDNQLKRKMIVVSLWCIQPIPSSRPSMSGVVQMLEGSAESIDIPQMPMFSSPPRLQWNPSTTSATTL